jgi:hypothetical protein
MADKKFTEELEQWRDYVADDIGDLQRRMRHQESKFPPTITPENPPPDTGEGDTTGEDTEDKNTEKPAVTEPFTPDPFWVLDYECPRAEVVPILSLPIHKQRLSKCLQCL